MKLSLRLFRQRLSIAKILLLGFGGLVGLSAGVVLFIGLGIAASNTNALIRDKATLIVKLVGDRARDHLDAVREQVEYLARLVARKDFDPSNQDALFGRLTASLAAVPQVSSVGYVRPDLQALLSNRDSVLALPIRLDLSRSTETALMMDTLHRSPETYWGSPIYSPRLQQTLLTVQTPVWRDDEFLGMFTAAVTVRDLSHYLNKLGENNDIEPFILIGPDEVLAHASLKQGFAMSSEEQPLPDISRLDDPVLRLLWDENGGSAKELPGHAEFEARLIRIGGERYVVVYSWLYGYGGIPWIVGGYFRESDIAAEFERVQHAAFAGGFALILAVVAALALGRWFARPVGLLAEAALQLRRFGPQQYTPLPNSRLFEINAANRAFNEMAQGLQERELLRNTFGKYVPASIADALLQDRGILKPHTQTATILFTDIAGFSTIAELMAPERLIAMLNEYFSVLVDIVERHHGVIHQFQGDAILATYNLPVSDPHHADHAIQTALDIQQTLASRRFDQGLALPTRVGINTGTVVGGTVGAGSRLGYTVHGDDVNLAARIEQMNKQYGTRILIAQSSVAHASGDYAFELIGELPVRGRNQAVVLYRIPES